MGPVREMEVTGQMDAPADLPCLGCGKEIAPDGVVTKEIAGIECEGCGGVHVYHVGCLPESTQVEIMLARLRQEGSL